MVDFHVPGSLHVPTVDYSDIEEQHRSFVFPSCGHGKTITIHIILPFFHYYNYQLSLVHGFHTMLLGKACPLCRAIGEFVPLAFDFHASLGNLFLIFDSSMYTFLIRYY